MVHGSKEVAVLLRREFQKQNSKGDFPLWLRRTGRWKKPTGWGVARTVDERQILHLDVYQHRIRMR